MENQDEVQNVDAVDFPLAGAEYPPGKYFQ